jgi:V/A-type H+-transporting ATPase subunit I
MIVPMAKVHAACRRSDADRLMMALRDLGVVHLAPVERATAVPDETTTATIEQLGRAVQGLKAIEPSGEPARIAPVEAAAEVLRVQRESAERHSRLNTLHRQVEQLAVWGNTRLAQLEELRQAGIEPRFFAVPNKRLGEIGGEMAHVICPLPQSRSLVAVIDRAGESSLPEGAEPLPLPARDRPSIVAEAAAVDASLRADTELLGRLAHLMPALEAELAQQRRQAAYTAAMRGGYAGDSLYAVQGWVPADRVDVLSGGLEKAGVAAAVQAQEPAPEDEPPTLFRPVRWARPIEALFKILGTVPGYREFDVSAAFMIALPIFSAMLISDAGYGLIYLLLPIIFYRKMSQQLAQLLIAIGAMSVIWGVITCSFFGYDFHRLLAAIPLVGALFAKGPLIVVGMEKPYPEAVDPMSLLMRISFILGAIHLSAAHLWRARTNFPNLSFLSNLGWAIWLWGMFGVVNMFVLGAPFKGTLYPHLLAVGGVMAILFAAPDRNPFKMIGLGIANFPLSAIATFGDTVSYVRLMAIGLAGSALAVAFNQMTEPLPWPVKIPILVVAHGLNVAVSIVALFAHGVRLNMLEFSNNLGMQWSGYAYEPFTNLRDQES